MNTTINKTRDATSLSAVSPPAVVRKMGLAADPQVSRIISLLELRPGEHVLDAGCGTGARGVELGYYGCKVTAIDPVGWRVAAARGRSAHGQSDVAFHKRDPREFVLLETFDAAVVSLEGKDLLDDRRILSNLAASLRTGGRLLIDAGAAYTSAALVTALLRTGFPRVNVLAPETRTHGRILAITKK